MVTASVAPGMGTSPWVESHSARGNAARCQMSQSTFTSNGHSHLWPLTNALTGCLPTSPGTLRTRIAGSAAMPDGRPPLRPRPRIRTRESILIRRPCLKRQIRCSQYELKRVDGIRLEAVEYNFGHPRVTVKREGSSNGRTGFVHLDPKAVVGRPDHPVRSLHRTQKF